MPVTRTSHAAEIPVNRSMGAGSESNQVIGTATIPIAAAVVYVEGIWDGTDPKFVGNPVNERRSLTAVSVDSSVPVPLE